MENVIELNSILSDFLCEDVVWKPGMRILFNKADFAYLGTITRIDSDGKIHFSFDDGSKHRVSPSSKHIMGVGVKRKHVKPIKMASATKFIESLGDSGEPVPVLKKATERIVDNRSKMFNKTLMINLNSETFFKEYKIDSTKKLEALLKKEYFDKLIKNLNASDRYVTWSHTFTDIDTDFYLTASLNLTIPKEIYKNKSKSMEAYSYSLDDFFTGFFNREGSTGYGAINDELIKIDSEIKEMWDELEKNGIGSDNPSIRNHGFMAQRTKSFLKSALYIAKDNAIITKKIDVEMPLHFRFIFVDPDKIEKMIKLANG